MAKWAEQARIFSKKKGKMNGHYYIKVLEEHLLNMFALLKYQDARWSIQPKLQKAVLNWPGNLI